MTTHGIRHPGGDVLANQLAGLCVATDSPGGRGLHLQVSDSLQAFIIYPFMDPEAVINKAART